MDGQAETNQPEKLQPAGAGSEKIVKPEISAFAGSEAARMIEQQAQQGLPRTVLATDIDNSFKMRRETPQQGEASRKLATEAYAASIPIHAITGGDFQGVYERIQKGELPYFQVISPSVGTERYVLHVEPDGSRRYVRDTVYDAQLKAMQYDRPHLARQLEGKTMGQLNQRYPGLRLDFQHPERERDYVHAAQPTTPEPYKLSCYFYAGPEHLKGVIGDLQREFPQQRVIVCEEVDYNGTLAPGEGPKKYCLDVLPVSKADALRDVSHVVGADINVIAGDSGNDIAMLADTLSDVSIEVGGAKPELREAMERVFGDSTGRLSFKKKSTEGTAVQYLFSERDGRRGPQSILQALRILVRAASINLDTVVEHYGLGLNVEYSDRRKRLRGLYEKLSQPTIDPELQKRVYHEDSTRR